CHGSTLGSLIPVVSITAGYGVRSATWGYELIAYRSSNPSSVLTDQNSGMFTGPFGENSTRRVSETPTRSITAAKRSDRSVSDRPTRMPPALPPSIPSFAADVYFCRIRYSALAMKSRHVFGFVSL